MSYLPNSHPADKVEREWLLKVDVCSKLMSNIEHLHIMLKNTDTQTYGMRHGMILTVQELSLIDNTHSHNDY